MIELDQKINKAFQGLVVRKDLVRAVKGNAIVPTYVLEYLLGQYCATSDDATIQAGIETVKEILAKHYVHRSEAGLVKSIIKERGRHKVIDKISVALNDKKGVYEAEFANLGLKKVLVDSTTVKVHPKLLVSGVWCIADIEYVFSEDKEESPWVLSALKPIQLSRFDFDSYADSRRQFTTDEWIDLLIQSMGFNPEMFSKRSKLMQLVRLIPFCERNYNVMELGPKGTGKSHIYSEFSPHGMLLSGGEVSVAKLFVNNSSGKIGLVGYWDVVAFDEFAGKHKRVDKALVDIMKNYMANKSFSRGIETIGAEASMAFVGNTQHPVAYMLKHSDLFDELPEKYHDSAFLDRVHCYIPGWEVDIIRGEMFSGGYGFVVDYLAEILRHLRNQDYSDRYQEHFVLSSDISTRDRDGINKTFSGLMKLIFPHREATVDEIDELLKFALEGRKRVKDQLMRIDSTYAAVRFSYVDMSGAERSVTTLEEREYPDLYGKGKDEDGELDDPGIVDDSEVKRDAIAGDVPEGVLGAAEGASNGNPVQIPAADISAVKGAADAPKVTAAPDVEPKEQHLTFQDNQKGVSYDSLFGQYLRGARNIVVTDPYIRMFYQVRNFMEFIETVAKLKSAGDEVSVHLITIEDEFKGVQQQEYFEKIKATCFLAGIDFTWEFDGTGSIHARHIVTDAGWKILLDRGLDIFQQYDMNESFSFSNRLQQFRNTKVFEVTYLKESH